MKSLNDRPAVSLEWRRAGCTPPDFELVGPDGVFAILTFKDPEHTLAYARTAEGDWSLKHLGLLNPLVTVREVGSTANLAIFHPHALRHGKLRFADGAVYDWIWHHDSGRDGEFQDADGARLVSLRNRPGRDLASDAEAEPCDVSLDLGTASRYRHALLATVAWFLVLCDRVREQEEAAAAMALRL